MRIYWWLRETTYNFVQVNLAKITIQLDNLAKYGVTLMMKQSFGNHT